MTSIKKLFKTIHLKFHNQKTFEIRGNFLIKNTNWNKIWFCCFLWRLLKYKYQWLIDIIFSVVLSGFCCHFFWNIQYNTNLFDLIGIDIKAEKVILNVITNHTSYMYICILYILNSYRDGWYSIRRNSMIAFNMKLLSPFRWEIIDNEDIKHYL